MKIVINKKNQIYLLIKEKKLLIGTLDSNSLTLTCNRKSSLHIFRKYNAICFNEAIMKLKLDKIVVILDNEKELTITKEKIEEFTSVFHAEYINGDEPQVMIPISLFDDGGNKASKSVDTFSRVFCPAPWKERLRDNNDYG